MFEKNTQTVWLGKSGGFEKPRGGQDGGKKLTPNQGRKQKKRGGGTLSSMVMSG
jgi:hypothetical protein